MQRRFPPQLPPVVLSNAKCCLECGVQRRFSPQLPPVVLCRTPKFFSVFIQNFNAIGFEAVDRVHHCRSGNLLKPASRTPFVLIRHSNQPMFHRILMDIIQPSQIRFLKRQFGVPVIEPDFSSLEVLQPIQFRRCNRMQAVNHCFQVLRFGQAPSDEVVMVGKNCPSLQLPFKLFGQGEQGAFQKRQMFRSFKQMNFSIRRSSDHKNSACVQPMHWSMRPIFLCG